MSDDGTGSETSTHSDMDMGDLPATEPRLVHFKCRHDPTWDYRSIANSLFLPDQKVLVVGEKWHSNPHVHMQGYTLDAPRTFADKLHALAKTHCTRNPDHTNYIGPKARPMSQGRGTVTVTGFQYMSKEPLSAHNPIFQRGFTQEEIEALHAASTELVEKKKTALKDYLHEKLTPADFQLDMNGLLGVAYGHVDDLLMAEKRAPTQFTRRDTMAALYTHPACSRPMRLRLINQRY